MKLIRTLAAAALVIAVLGLSGECRDQSFAEVDAQTFRALLEDSGMHSAASWWYLGEADGYCHFVEKRAAFEKRRIMVKSSEIEYSREDDLRYPSPEADWIHLESADLEFDLSASG